MKMEEKYKPDKRTYRIIISVLLTFIVLFQIAPIDNEIGYLDDILVGALASVFAASLLDLAECNRKNQEYAAKKKLVFTAYQSSMNELRMFPARRCLNYCDTNQKRTLKEWLFILASDSTYEGKGSVWMREHHYKRLVGQINAVKNTVEALLQQYFLLIENDIFDDDKWRQHLNLQKAICEDICDGLELAQYSSDSIYIANDLVVELFNNFETMFPGYFKEERYDHKFVQ